MQSLIQQVSKQCPDGVHTILVVGAAHGGDLQDWRKLGSKRLVLTEAHPDLAAELSRRIDAARGEEVWPLAITPSAQESALLHICNNPRFSSLQPPRELNRYFPSLKMTGETKVSARTFGAALQQVLPAEDADNLLVLAAPGQTADLIRSVPAEQLQAFRLIIVRVGAMPLYEGDDANACLASLKTAGFDSAQEDSGAIHPDRVVLLKRNDTRVRSGRLEARLKQVASLQAQVQKLMQERDIQTKAAAQYTAAAEKANQQISELTQSLSDRDALLKKVSRQNQERGARIIALDKQQVELKQRQRWLDEEMIKAEAQTEFIKDVFLQDRTP